MQSGAIYLSQGFEDCILGSSLILCSCLLLRLTLTTPTEKQNKILRLTVPKKSLCTWLEECCRQVEAEEVSNNRNKIHQTTYKDFFRALYSRIALHGIFGLRSSSCIVTPIHRNLIQTIA